MFAAEKYSDFEKELKTAKKKKKKMVRDAEEEEFKFSFLKESMQSLLLCLVVDFYFSVNLTMELNRIQSNTYRFQSSTWKSFSAQKISLFLFLTFSEQKSPRKRKKSSIKLLKARVTLRILRWRFLRRKWQQNQKRLKR